ncbi:MAG: DUF4743 domain-containing protein [Deltaproteobacteria bacterium]|nr:DUF4743 domain-containing protein [Deltaproteobacteria bacterium]HBI29773.1 DUF4743 domain-containing protein [Deltaproteobacteria bacterium]
MFSADSAYSFFKLIELLMNDFHHPDHNLQRWVRRCNARDLTRFASLRIGDTVIGWVPKDHRSRFREHSAVFGVTDTEVWVQEHLNTPEARTSAVGEVLAEWRKRGWVPGWRDELYRVSTRFDDEPLLLVERAAAQPLGICSYGVHLNGFVEKSEGLWMWIARRAKDRPHYPGYLDQLVAGGLTAGQSAWEVTLRECWEEAGIPESLAQRCRPNGFVTVFMDHYGLIKRDLLFTYDLELPEDFEPENTDGEVEGFELLPIEEVVRLVAETDEIKLNCNLVIIDFFVRHGILTPEHPHYSAIVLGLRAGGCA